MIGARSRLRRIDAHIWVALSLLLVSTLFNAGIAPHHLIIGLYLFPTLFAAFYAGRRSALLTAAATVVLVYAMCRIKPALFAPAVGTVRTTIDVVAWAGMMLLTAFVVGTLTDKNRQYVRELRDTYRGVLLILSHLIAQDSYTETHSQRVSLIAVEVATCLNMTEEQIEDIRAAALLHDIGKLQVSRELLYKAARLNDEEYREMMEHVGRGAELLSHVGGSLRRVIPIVLAHHDKFDGTGENHLSGSRIPIGARVIAVADVFDALISDRPYRKAMAPFEAREAIQRGSGTDFDPQVVAAFLKAFGKRRLDIRLA